MKEKAFTLIEVMVVMAIISILAGMMMPQVWRFWESQDIATTKQRMLDLRTAMVGDRTLIQNGARTNFGFVGDHGMLPPFGQLSSARRYLPAGVDLSTYDKDSWGRPFEYDPSTFPVMMRSYGPNGIANDTDDIKIIPIEEKEVIPLTTVSGNNPTTNTLLQLIITPENSSAFEQIDTGCFDVTTSPYNHDLVTKLPIGRIRITMKSFSISCTTPSTDYSFVRTVNDHEQVILLPDLR